MKEKNSDPTQEIRTTIASLIQSAGRSSAHSIQITADSIEQPPDEKLGDFSFPCFALAKELKKSPVEIAKILAEHITKLPPIISSVTATGPYVNFFLDPKVIMRKLLRTERLDPRLLRNDKKKKTVVIEYVSPNTNKPLHLGHIRNATLGDSVARLNEYEGKRIIRTCLVNDRGIHICKSMVAYQRMLSSQRKTLGDTPKSTKKKGDHLVGEYYVLYETLLKKDPDIEMSAQECLRKWEAGDKKTRALWKKMNSWVFNGMDATYKRLGIYFDKTYLESDMYTQGKDIIMKGLSTGVFNQDETGAIYAGLETFNLPNKILLRKDGSTIYITQDIYLALKKWQDFKPDASVYVVGSEQNLYLQQLFAVLKLLHVHYADHLTHLSYGMVRLPEGKMKSREGTVVDADDLIDELVGMVREEITKRDENTPEKEIKKRSETIALAALKFFLLIVGPSSDMTFNPKESIALHGRTGPYILYTYARLKSIARKAGASKIKAQESKLKDYDFLEEKKLAVTLMYFEETIHKAALQSNPSLLANYLYELAQNANDYYHATPVLKAAPHIRTARLLLMARIADTLKMGLGLLGIKTIEKM